jgi:c-di-GMP-binding flagellar brake protein YcgR
MQDKRKYPRLDAKVDIVIKNVSRDAINFKDETKLVTRDITVAGVCFVTRKSLKVGDVIEMKIILPNGEPVSPTGVVRWVAEQGTVKGLGLSDFYVGVQFTNITNGDRALLGQYIYENMKR